MSKSRISFYFEKSSGSKIELLLSPFSARASSIGIEGINFHHELETSNSEEYFIVCICIINSSSTCVENLRSI